MCGPAAAARGGGAGATAGSGGYPSWVRTRLPSTGASWRGSDGEYKGGQLGLGVGV